MKVLHIIAELPEAAGTTTFVRNLISELGELGVRADIVVKSQRSIVTKRFLSKYDIAHLHGLWDPFLHFACKITKQTNVPMVWSPHGMIQKWAIKNKWYKKFVALALYQWRDLHAAELLHATAQSEVEDIRRLGLANDVVVAPLGVRMCNNIAKMEGEKRTLLFVSRVQRKKGLPNLIDAWSRLPSELRNGWQVRIVGPNEDNHIAELKGVCDSLGLKYQDLSILPETTVRDCDITFVGPRYDAELNAEYANADIFVLPTHSENFGSVVIESLARGVPVITTRESPWAELEEHKCGWWIDDSAEALYEALRMAMILPREILREMGKRGRALVERKYTWKNVAKIMLDAYKEIADAN